MNIATEVRIKTQIKCAATGKVVKDNPWKKNLVLNSGLNGLAQSSALGLAASPPSLTLNVLIGSNVGNTPNSIASGAVTFTQAATTITASAPFFTAGMVGMLFKYGSGSAGAEYYITAFTSSTVVTVDTSATVAAPTVATVWAVNRTTLDTFLFKSTTYQTNAGDNESTFTGNTATFKRTVVFPVQGSSYNVNEIGYAPVSNGSNFIAGRIVLSSTDVVATSNFYVVIISVTFTFSPASPTAVINVGTNINTAGNAMVEWFATGNISSTGAVSSTSADIFGGFGSPRLGFALATYTQGTTVATAPPVTFTGGVFITSVGLTYVASSVGKCRWSYSGVGVSTTGQTCYGFGIMSGGSSTQPAFDVKFTTPQTLPTGTLQPICVFEMTYGRTLTN